MKRRFLTLFLAVALLLLATGCSGTPTTTAATTAATTKAATAAATTAAGTTAGSTAAVTTAATAGNEIVIGTILDTSAGMAAAGKATVFGVDYAVKEINDKGGINGKKIRVIHYDVKGDPNEAITAYNRLVDQDKVTAVVGPGLSNIGIALAPIAEAKKVPVVSHFMDERATTNEKTGEAWKYIYLAEPSCNQQAEAVAAYTVDKLKLKSVAILYDSSNAYSTTHAIPYQKYVEGKGMKVTAVESFTSDAKDYKAQLTKIIATKPEAIFVPSYAQQNALAYKQARQLGFKGIIIGNNTYSSPFNTLVEGTPINDLYFIYNVDFNSDNTKFLGDAYKAANNGAIPLPNAAFGYDNVKIIENALRLAKNPNDPIEVNTLIETKTQNVKTSSGPITLDPKTHRPVGMGVFIAKWDTAGKEVSLLDYYKS